MKTVTPEQKAEQQIDALRALYDLFVDQLKEIVRTEIAAAMEGKSKAVSASDATTINVTEKAKEVLTEKEASEFLQLSRITLYNLRESGKLSYVRIGSRVLYRRRDLYESYTKSWIEDQSDSRTISVAAKPLSLE